MSNQVTAWAVADPSGKGPAGTSLDWLTSMRDHTLHLDGYERWLQSGGFKPAAGEVTSRVSASFSKSPPLFQ